MRDTPVYHTTICIVTCEYNKSVYHTCIMVICIYEVHGIRSVSGLPLGLCHRENIVSSTKNNNTVYITTFLVETRKKSTLNQ